MTDNALKARVDPKGKAEQGSNKYSTFYGRFIEKDLILF